MTLEVDSKITALVVEMLERKYSEEYFPKGHSWNDMERDIWGPTRGRGMLAQYRSGKGIGRVNLQRFAKFLGKTTEQISAEAEERARALAALPSNRIDPLDLAFAVAEDLSKDGYAFNRDLLTVVRAARVDNDPLAWRRAALTLLKSKETPEPPDQPPPEKRPITPSNRPHELEHGALSGSEQLAQDADSRRLR